MRLIDADNLKIPNDAPYKASVKRVVAQQPTVEVEPKWIPVEEKLPEKDGEYLCQREIYGNYAMEVLSFSNNLYKVDKYDFFDCKDKKGFYGYDSECGYLEYSKIEAWMPLPEPYRKE